MGDRRLTALWGLMAVQAFCAVFFLFDAVTDWMGLEDTPGLWRLDAVELLAALSLTAGLVGTGLLIRQTARHQAALRRQVDIASGALSEVIERQFESWGLTVSEREVAMLSIKGFAIAEIAAMRNTKEGTVKAQNASVYRKAGVTGRLQLLSLFIEDLMADPLVDPDTGQP